jgi:thiol-disulfide isomerase/thioredoxin
MTKRELIDIIKSGEKTYLYFYSPFCGSCERMEPLLENVGTPMKKIIGFEDEDILDAFNIEVYPTIVEINGMKKRTFKGSAAVRNLLK